MPSHSPVSSHRGSAANLSPCAALRTRALACSRSLRSPRCEEFFNGPRSVATLTANHSTYPLLELRNASNSTGGVSSTSRGPGGAVGSHTWLAACVRHIVSMSGNMRGPILQLVFSSSNSNVVAARTNGSGSYQHRFEALPISRAVADNPQKWTEFAAHVRRSGANGLVLVRPIASPDQHCIYAPSTTPSTPAPSPRPPSSSSASFASPTDALRQPVAACCSNPEGGAAAAHANPLTVVLETQSGSSLDGRLGACCDDHTQDPCAPRATGASHQVRGDDGSGGADDGSTRYYGLVVQGSAGSEADGCWVLKTTRSDGGGGGSGALGVCSCVHFSLTRVCVGQPLSVQLRDAWLVPEPAGAAAGGRGGGGGRA